MGTSKDNLIQRITELEGNLMEEQETVRLLKSETKRILEESNHYLKESKNKVTYIHETSHLYCSDGEMHIQYGDCDNENWVVYNTDQLFKDLPFIINQVIKENKKMQSYYLGQIKKELLDLMVEGEDKYMDIEDQVINEPKDELNGI